MKKLVFLIVFTISLLPLKAFTLNWIELHEKSSALNLKDALFKVREKPESKEDLYILGLTYLNLHKDDLAKITFEKLIAQDDSLFQAKWGLAETLRRKNNITKAEKILQEIIKTNPGFSPAYHLRSWSAGASLSGATRFWAVLGSAPGTDPTLPGVPGAPKVYPPPTQSRS